MQFPLPCKKGQSRLGSSAITDEKAENANGILRKTLLEEINQFLEHMGWPVWKAQMNLYKDWFIPEVLKVSGADSAKGETLVLVHKRRICSKRQCRESKESRAEATGNDREDEDIP